MKTLICRSLKAWDGFWFKSQPLFFVSVFRLVFFFVLGTFYAIRWVDYDFLFSDLGILPERFLQTVWGEDFKSLIPWHLVIQNSKIGFILHGVFVMGLYSMALGWIGRKFSWLIFILHLAFFQRNPLTVFGADLAATAWFGSYCLFESNRFFHFKFWEKNWRKSWKWNLSFDQFGDRWNSIGIRFIQIQLCSIYGNSGLDKLKGMSWWKGDSLMLAFSNPQLMAYDLSFLSYFPMITVVISYATLLWEIYFPVLIWVKKLRPGVLILGILLHLGIATLMQLYFFAAIMLSSYILFLDPDATRRFVSRILRSDSRSGRFIQPTQP